MKSTCQICYDLRHSDCTHIDSQRAITGFWCTNEVQKALEKGYNILYIYEVWHSKETPEDLWRGYIRKFLQIKL
jgi:hypothetical protein